MKKLLRIFSYVVLSAVLLFGVVLAILWAKQDDIVQELITAANEDFQGQITLEGSHLSPFVNFPYTSIDLEGLRIYEHKDTTERPLLELQDLYIGLDIITVISGDFEIKSIKAANGHLDLEQYTDGSMNLLNALATTDGAEAPDEDLHLNLKQISVEQVLLNKHNQESDLTLIADVEWAETSFESNAELMDIELSSAFALSVIQQGDTSFIHDKNFEITTGFNLDNATQLATVLPSAIQLENALFAVEGTIDLKNDANLDLTFEGRKDNFDLLLAFAPPELAPTLDRYSNAGDIFFDATLKGKSVNGHSPALTANFGCEDGYFSNDLNNKRLDEMQFKGHFYTFQDEGPEAMEFAIESFSVRPEAGIFAGGLIVKNFDAPDINLQLDSDFDLDFLSKFLNVEELQDLRGHVMLRMNFHDIIDLERPETSIERLNESYYTELEVTDLGFTSPDFHLPIEDIDVMIRMDGHAASIENFSFRAGQTDLQLTGEVDDLPAILHHTDIPVNASLTLRSERIDLLELTSGDTLNSKPFNEVLTDVDTQFSFKASARAFTESKNLPIGEFLIDRLSVTMQNYPHRLHDFTADVFIEEEDFRVIDFRGLIDESDFHFNGRLRHYDLWFAEQPQGDTELEFDLDAKQLQLEDLFSYGGDNYIPADYRHEVLSDLLLHGRAYLHFKDTLHSADLYLDNFGTSLLSHEMRVQNISGRTHLERGYLTVENMNAKIGESDVTIDLTYDLRQREVQEQKDALRLTSSRLNFDQLFAWKLPEDTTEVDHDPVFSIFDIPFPDMDYTIDIARMNYHTYDIRAIKAEMRSTREQMLYVDTLHMELADGVVDLNGYFSAKDRKQIYLTPNMTFSQLDLDKLLIKFDNFGQDAIVAENLHGRLSGALNGKVHMHADLVPIIDDTELHIDIEVLNGRLDDYEPMQMLADYFQDKNLNRIAFDTLANHLDVQNGELSIPNMRINSTLGFIELSGKQDFDLNMDYIIRVPWRLVSQAGKQKLFGRFRKDEGAAEAADDEIIRAEDGERVRFVNVRMKGTPDDFEIDLIGRKKATAVE
jgi:hypothetical protein